jgi:acyl CoA:acetate/3-ketoacid CoA transferase alpha subunit
MWLELLNEGDTAGEEVREMEEGDIMQGLTASTVNLPFISFPVIEMDAILWC